MDAHPFGWLSLLPPLVAIVLAIVTRRIVFSLVMGIYAGALLMAGGHPLVAIYNTWETHLWSTMIDAGKLRVFSFTILMGAMIGVITRSGGMQGLIELVSPYASNRRRGQLATWFLGILIFFDDYANTILLGSTLRPVCDRLKISREKLAYLVDSTAAPVAALAPVSTWVAVEIDYIASGLESVPGDGMTAFGLFLASIPYRFYIWAALLLVPITAILGRDIGAMVGAEQRVQGDDASREVDDMQLDTARAASSSWYNAVLPIGVTLALVVYFIWTTGSQSACDAAAESAIASASALTSDGSQMDVAIAGVKEAAGTGNVTATKSAIGELARSVESFSQLSAAEASRGLQPKLSVRDIVGAADSSLALQYGALAGLCLACLMPLFSRLLSVNELIAGAASGARVVLPAIAILWCASAMSRMTTDKSVEGVKSDTPYAFKDHRLYTADYLTQVLTGNDTSESPEQATMVSAQYLPTIVFILAAVVAFCTGTSWGTMGILVPMVVQTSHAMLSQGGGVVPPNDPILLSSIGGVLAGAVFGDHCSPISDTTVLSSQSSGCDHLAHVWTQMPYALLAAGVSILLGTLPIGFGVSIWILLPLQLLALFGFMRLMGTKTD